MALPHRFQLLTDLVATFFFHLLKATDRVVARNTLTNIQRRWDAIGKVPRDQVRAGVLTHAQPAWQAFAHLPRIAADAETVEHLRRSGVAPAPPEHIEDGQQYVICDAADDWMVALVERRGDKAQPLRVLARPDGA